MKKIVLSTGLILGVLFTLNAQIAHVERSAKHDVTTGVNNEIGDILESSDKQSRNDFTVSIRVYLEGALTLNNDEVGESHGRPLMRDELRVSPYNAQRYIPDTDPYSTMDARSWENGEKRYQYIPSEFENEFNTIKDPLTVFEVVGEDAIVDWVFVELRSKLDNTVIVASRSGLVQRDGDVVDLDGVSKLSFPGVDEDDYFVVVRHRNHLGAMTAEAKTPKQLHELIDFTQLTTGIFDFGDNRFEGKYDYDGLAQNQNVKQGFLALWGGDYNGDGKIKYSSPNDDIGTLFGNIIGYELYDDDGNLIGYNFNTNFDMTYGYLSGDFYLDSKVRFSNPIDDRNPIFATLLFHPLNSAYDIGFDFFIEQVPE
ncbi:MAG: hypothetical protein AAGA77_21415 [Bacteroidota bacterium]